MKRVVAPPGYLPPISYMAVFFEQAEIHLLNDSHYQKQTHRNRASIYGANGKLNLSIPIEHSPSNGRRKDREVLLANAEPWQKNHWKSIETAYRSSPFFEYYESYFYPFYTQKYTHLHTLNTELIQTFFTLIERPKVIKWVAFNPEIHHDCSHLLTAKGPQPPTPHYTQVFENKHGYINNLSAIDLLFNLGPETATYLQKLVNP